MENQSIAELSTTALLRELVSRATPIDLIKEELTKHPQIASIEITALEDLAEQTKEETVA